MENVLTLAVTENVIRRLDTFIAEKVPALSRSHIKTLIDSGHVKLNGNIVEKAGIKVKIDDKILVLLREPNPSRVLPENIPLDIIYEDNDIAVINKPQGMVTHPAPGNYTGTLVNAALFKLKGLSGIGGELRPGIVHRLDKDTSGIIVMAKNDSAHKSLADQISNREVIKEYLALVHGNIINDQGTIKTNIGRHKTDRKKMAVTRIGRDAITDFEVLKRYGKYTFVKFNIKTGRTHQIRVHAKHMGHPVVGDKTYSNLSDSFDLNGQMLHAQRMVFKHPRDGKLREFIAPLPNYFEDLLKKLDN